MNSFVRIILLAFLGGLLSLRNDGFFPFSSESNPTLMIVISTLHIILIAIILYFFFKPQRLVNLISKFANSDKVPKLLIILITIVFNVMSVILLMRNNKNFPDIYHL